MFSNAHAQPFCPLIVEHDIGIWTPGLPLLLIVEILSLTCEHRLSRREVERLSSSMSFMSLERRSSHRFGLLHQPLFHEGQSPPLRHISTIFVIVIKFFHFSKLLQPLLLHFRPLLVLNLLLPPCQACMRSVTSERHQNSLHSATASFFSGVSAATLLRLPLLSNGARSSGSCSSVS